VLALAPAAADGRVGYELTGVDGARLGVTSTPPERGQTAALDAVVADLLSPRGSTATQALATRAVRYVVVPPGPAAEPLRDVLDQQPALSRRSDEQVLLWEVGSPAGALTVVPGEQAPTALSESAPSGSAGEPLAVDRPLRDGVRADLPAGDDGRLLVLGEAADDDWSATLDGERLERRTAWGWAQAFVLPAGGGALEVAHDGERSTALTIQALVLLLVGVLAAPGARRRRGLEVDTTDDATDGGPDDAPETAVAPPPEPSPPGPVRAAGTPPEPPRDAPAAPAGRRRRAARRARARRRGDRLSRRLSRRRRPPPPSTTAPTAAPPAPVVGAVAVCPDVQQDGAVVQTSVSAGISPSAPVGGGAVTAARLGSEPAAVGELSGPGLSLTGLGAGVDDDALVVRAQGPLAAGLSVQQSTRAGGPERGLSEVRCEAPRTSAWFVGGSTAVGAESTLVLVNADETPALVDVTLFTPDGPAERRPGRGITVRPRSRTLVPLDRLAPGQAVLAAHVATQRGRVAAGLRHVRSEGSIARGAEWVPRSPEPAAELVVPGLPAGPGERALLLSNPGDDDTTVALEVTTGDGQFVPAGLEQIDVPAGSTVVQDLSQVLATTPAAVQVRSAGAPVLAAGLVSDGAPGAVAELAYVASATAPLDAPALLPDVSVAPGTDSTLLLSATSGDAVVDLVPVALAGQPAPPPARRVDVPGGRTVGVPLSSLVAPGASARFGLRVAPSQGSSPVHVTRYLRSTGSAGPLLSSLTLRGEVAEVPRPAVVRDPLVGAPGDRDDTTG
jgi:hypothetical protein